jgi:hypothetical protein
MHLRYNDEIPVAHQLMTRHLMKYQDYMTTEILNDPSLNPGVGDRLNRWNQSFILEPTNRFGVKTAQEIEVERRYAPAGMYNQIFASRAKGNEMRTMPVRMQYNSAL